MSAYLQFFELESSPFDTTAQSKLVLGTRALRAAFKQIEDGLAEGAPRICLSGKAGMGKTSLVRALPKLLGDGARVVVILNPSLPWSTLRTAIARQLDLEGGVLSRKTLMAVSTSQRRLVLVIDQAENISKESLEHLDTLLNYRSDDDAQLLHAVLLANLDNAAKDSSSPLLWWLDSLTTLQLEFAPIPAKGIGVYIEKHLKRAGWKGESLFTPDAIMTIHRLTGGVPRAVSELCEALLAEAAERGVQSIGPEIVEIASGEDPLELTQPVEVEDDTPEPTADEMQHEVVAETHASAPRDGRSEVPDSASRGVEPRGPTTDVRPEPASPQPSAPAPSPVQEINRGAGQSLTSLDAYFGRRPGAHIEPAGALEEPPTSITELEQSRLGPKLIAAAVVALALIGAAVMWTGSDEVTTTADVKPAVDVQAEVIRKRPAGVPADVVPVTPREDEMPVAAQTASPRVSPATSEGPAAAEVAALEPLPASPMDAVSIEDMAAAVSARPVARERVAPTRVTSTSRRAEVVVRPTALATSLAADPDERASATPEAVPTPAAPAAKLD